MSNPLMIVLAQWQRSVDVSEEFDNQDNRNVISISFSDYLCISKDITIIFFWKMHPLKGLRVCVARIIERMWKMRACFVYAGLRLTKHLYSLQVQPSCQFSSQFQR
jgi:hypothetical protein